MAWRPAESASYRAAKKKLSVSIAVCIRLPQSVSFTHHRIFDTFRRIKRDVFLLPNVVVSSLITSM